MMVGMIYTGSALNNLTLALLFYPSQVVQD